MSTITGDLPGGQAARGYNPSMYELLKTVNDPAELRSLSVYHTRDPQPAVKLLELPLQAP